MVCCDVDVCMLLLVLLCDEGVYIVISSTILAYR